MEEMTLSQALRRSSKLKGALKDHLARAAGSVTYKVGALPAYKFSEQLEAAEHDRAELIALQTAIRATNAQTQIDFGNRKIRLAEAIRTLEEIKGSIEWLRALPVLAQPLVESQEQGAYSALTNQYAMTTVQHKCDLPEAERAARVAAEQEKFDQLNDAVETANHCTMLVR